MILINSAASRPTIDNVSTMFLFNVWLVCPLSTGTITSAPAITSTCCMVDCTCSTTFGNVSGAPWVITIPCSSQLCKPGALTVTV